MNSDNTENAVQPIIPTGTLRELELSQIQPSTDNPRILFDPEPLAALKESIKKHGVLVPLTVHLPPGATIYRILDGERRYKCCKDLAAEGIYLKIKANIVDTPDKLSGLLAMFSIHNFREGWELMPTALSLQDVMEELDEESADTRRLRELTGLSEPQIERCKLLIELPERFQLLSLDPNPVTRIPSNFWIEAAPVREVIEARLPRYVKELGGSEGVLDRLVDKYRVKAIKSVIHFRRVMEAFTLPSEADPDFACRSGLKVSRLRRASLLIR
jgi:ParB family transcriptional regulator, chromosome partitioning protein